MTAQMTAEDIQKVYAQGLALQTAGNLNEALKLFGSIIKANPRTAEAYYQVGRILTSVGKVARALPYLKEAVRLRPAETAVWQAWADAIALGGDGDAEAEFLRVLKTAPVEAKARIALQDRFGARRASTQPATGGVNGPDLRRLLALMKAQQFADAEKLASTLLGKHPGSAIALNVLGTAQVSQGKTTLGIANLQKAVRTDPTYAEAYDNLGRIYLDLKRDDEAIVQLRRAVSLAPGLPSALVNLATSQTRADQPGAALHLLERALAAGANPLPCYLALGNTHTKLKDYAKAEEAFARALDLSTQSPGDAAKRQSHEAAGLLAQAQARLGKDAEAMENFKLALAHNSDSPVATVGMASLLQTLGRFDEAEVLFRRGIALDPDNGENYRLFIASYKTKPGDPIIAQMQALFDKPGLPPRDRSALGFAIAKALEDVKDYDRIFYYLDEANALVRQEHPYDIKKRLEDVENTKAACAEFDWHGTMIEGTTDFAPIFVTGMPRSGTTLIEQIISSHSKVTGAGELGTITRSAQLLLQLDQNRQLVKDLQHDAIAALGRDYEASVRERFAETPHITDKSIQTYMYMGLIKLALPNARFIVVRRDPRDTLLSMYKNKFPDDTHHYAYSQRDLAVFYQTFVEMVDFWRERVADWFYEVQYEALVANPEEESRKLIAACGLEWEDACLNFHENTRKVQTLSVFQVRQPISGGSVKGWKRHEKDLQPMLAALREQGLVTD